jgi:hypothetical protein
MWEVECFSTAEANEPDEETVLIEDMEERRGEEVAPLLCRGFAGR